MFRGHHRKVRLLFGISDVVFTALAFALAYRTRVFLEGRAPGFGHDFFLTRQVAVLLLGWSMAVWVAAAAWWEIYDRIDTAHPRVILRDTFRQCLLGSAAIVLLEFILRLDLSRTFLGLFAIFAWVFLCLFRLNAGRLLGMFRRGFMAPHYVMVVGSGEPARRVGEQIEAAADYGVRLTGFLIGENEPVPAELSARHPVRPLDELPELLRQHVIDEIIFAVDGRRLVELEEMFVLCEEEGVRTRVMVDFFPQINSQIHLERLGSLPLLTFSATPHDEIRLLLKRVTDVVLAGAALLLLCPFMLLIALLIRLTSPGPAIFRQTRCGLNGRTFVFYKFRSMCQDAEAMRASLAHMNQRTTVFKIPDDPRLTPVGRFLRKFSIDEWPQLWNVLKGDMSLVGPRPPLPEEVAQYQRWQRRRLRMRPGLTCLWAVKGRDRLDFESWMKLDMQYIDSWSLGLDWRIILRTIPHVLSGRGAH
ncbi:MAG TPA: sugar transferase [Bryobacteraceae bacterium]|nr:sugar transferase [Bryobacteraceae bacterium]